MKLAGIPDGSLVTLDSTPIIYYLQDHPVFAARFSPLFDAISQQRLSVAISSVTLSEVLAGPIAAGNDVLAARYREVLCRSPGWQLVAMDETIAVEAARLRARYKLRLPDAVQLATAIATRSYALITHDSAFRKVQGMRILGV